MSVSTLLSNLRIYNSGTDEYHISYFNPKNKGKGLEIPGNGTVDITVFARVTRIRKKSNKLCFILLSYEDVSIQVCFNESDKVTRDYIKETVAKISPESFVKVTGVLVKSPFKIDTATIKEWEIKATEIEVISQSVEIPIQVYKPDASLPVRLDNRCLDLRHIEKQLIFQINSTTVHIIIEYLEGYNFLQIFTPKIMSGVSESGSEVFKLDYFGREASLAQSPQLYKQMAINSGMGHVFEIGPVFRAEKSDGSRHLTQYTSVDIEMIITEDYHYVIELLYQMINKIFSKNSYYMTNILKSWKELHPEWEYPMFTDEPVILTYKDCVKMLTESEYGCQRPEDLNHQDEFNLGKIVKEKFSTDLFVIDEYPQEIRPFYTYPNKDGTSRSYDFVFKGCEILSGAQRINNYEQLVKSAKDAMGEVDSIKNYLDTFQFGSPPHGGGAFGLERLIARFLDIENIRETSLFPRDPGRLMP
jgi:aspartyl-tRNA synthetase